jgi:hypothetical protein
MPEPCHHKLCFEMKYRTSLYLMKSDLLAHLRELHRVWWQRYEQLYEKGSYRLPSRTAASGWDYSIAAKEMLTRCRMFDALYNKVLEIDLVVVKEFGDYCKRVFMEINKLRPAFPDSPESVGVFDLEARDLRKFVMLRHAEDEESGEGPAAAEPTGAAEAG